MIVSMCVVIIAAIFTGITGYVIGTVKVFRDQKQRVYAEIVPPIVQGAYNPGVLEEQDFTRAMNLLWLYGSKKVALEWEKALSIIHDRQRGDLTKALQKAITTMRKDIQISPFQKLKPDEVNHIYTHITRQ
jgi:hypothetical protein